MRIEVERKAPWTVLNLSGDLDAEAGPSLYLQFQRELLQGQTRFLFDLDGVEVVDSAGLGVLVRCHKDARGRGGEICLGRVPGAIERILEFTRLDSILRIVNGSDSADLPAAA